MGEITKVLKEDLAVQKKKLADLEAWKSDAILIEMQKSIVSELEKKTETMQNAV